MTLDEFAHVPDDAESDTNGWTEQEEERYQLAKRLADKKAQLEDKKAQLEDKKAQLEDKVLELGKLYHVTVSLTNEIGHLQQEFDYKTKLFNEQKEEEGK